MFLLVLMSVIGGLSAQMPMDKTPMSKGCCMPNQYTMSMINVGGAQKPGQAPTVTDIRAIVDIDYTMRMQRLQMVNIASGELTDVWLDYNNSKSYSVVKGTCYASPYLVPMNSPCLDANATYVGTYMMGSGSEMISVDQWTTQKDGFRVDLQVQADTCTTVSMQTFGDLKDGTKEVLSYVFADIKKDQFSMASPFTLPDSCKNPTMVGQ